VRFQTESIGPRLVSAKRGSNGAQLARDAPMLMVRWADRLGRNYQDVCDNIREFMRHGVVIKTVINGLTFDGATKDPMRQAVRDALIAFMAAIAQAQAEATSEARRAGIAHARAKDPGSYRGRKPTFTRSRVFCGRQPMIQVDWNDACKYVTWLSRLTGKPTVC
jgi:putative DNA-invertase from lambdoid prophage Rac